jgi:NAD(P)H-dependent FMN reductase
MAIPQIGIVIGTTREGRFADAPARWIAEAGAARGDLALEIVDLRDYPLPFFDEPTSPAYGTPRDAVAQRWGRKVAALDGFIFVTGEYNRSIPGVLKNALDYAYAEFARKPAAYVGYGGTGGARAIEHLRLISVELQMAPMRNGVHIGLQPYLEVAREGRSLAEYDFLNQSAATMLDELAWWARVLKGGRTETRLAA